MALVQHGGMPALPLIHITRQSGYRFLVDFAPGMSHLMVDEPPPLGTGTGPSPSQLLSAAVANCLCASLTFALQKFKQDPGSMQARVLANIDRNEANRLRVSSINVEIQLGVASSELSHLDRALAQFEDFCTVSASVREGVSIDLSVFDVGGQRLR